MIAALLVQLSARSQYHAHPILIGAITDTVTASEHKEKHVVYYRLTIIRPGHPNRIMTLGALTDERSRAVILKALKDSLHKALLFPPDAPTTFDPTDQRVDQLINDLILEAYPYTNINTVAETELDENNKLRLLYQPADRKYQLSLVTPSGRTSLLHYDPPPGELNYKFDWGNVANQKILDNFDQLMLLYFMTPSTLVKPTLYLQPQPLTSEYQLVYSYNGHTIIQDAGIILPKEMKDKLAVQSVVVTTPAGAHATLLKIIDPASQATDKKTKDDPITFKENQH